MKGQEIIDYIVQAKMPDREQVRMNCLRQSAQKTHRKIGTWVMRIAPVAACAVILLIVALTLGRNEILNPQQAAVNVSDDITAPAPDHLVYIPAIELPKNAENADMIGLFVYRGRIYTQTAFYYERNVADSVGYGYSVNSLCSLIGDKVGFATGSINEWSTQEEYAVEFAGTVRGDVYTVNGHNPYFRLCMMAGYTDDNGNKVRGVNFYECLNGYGLTWGSNLFVFRDILEVNKGEVISEKWSHIKYQDHDNWMRGEHKLYHDLDGVTDKDISRFLYEVYFGKFEYLYETLGSDFNDDSNLKRTHLHLYMDDGTVVELCLIEGGYVMYRHLWGYAVKIPGGAFDTLFNACQ